MLESLDYSSADINEVWNWVPSSPEQVFFQLTIEIGEKGKKGGNLFQAVIATPEGLDAARKKYGDRFPNRGMLILKHYSWENLLKRLDSIVSQCSRENWFDSISCLQQHLIWEYEE